MHLLKAAPGITEKKTLASRAGARQSPGALSPATKPLVLYHNYCTITVPITVLTFCNGSVFRERIPPMLRPGLWAGSKWWRETALRYTSLVLGTQGGRVLNFTRVSCYNFFQFRDCVLSVNGVNRAPVAQWIRASDFGSEGRGFESLQARHSRVLFPACHSCQG